MKDHARGFLIASVVLMLALPVFYIGTEGVWYLATEESRFPDRSTYRTVYAPLDWAGDRWPPVYEAREGLANGWLRLSGDPLHKALIHPDWHPSPFGSADYVRYFPPDPELKLSREAAARMQLEAEPEATADAADGTSCPVELADAADG